MKKKPKSLRQIAWEASETFDWGNLNPKVSYWERIAKEVERAVLKKERDKTKFPHHKEFKALMVKRSLGNSTCRDNLEFDRLQELRRKWDAGRQCH